MRVLPALLFLSATAAPVIFSTGSSGTNTGDVTLTPVGSASNANGASLSGQALTLQPADAGFPGVVTADPQIFNGQKKFRGGIAAGTDIFNVLGVAPQRGLFIGADNPVILLETTDAGAVSTGSLAFGASGSVAQQLQWIVGSAVPAEAFNLKQFSVTDSNTVHFRIVVPTGANTGRLYFGGWPTPYLSSEGEFNFQASLPTISGGADSNIPLMMLREKASAPDFVQFIDSANTVVARVLGDGGFTTSANVSAAGTHIASGTSSPAFQCTGAAACGFQSASGQNATLDSAGGTSTVSVGATNATTTTVGRTGQTLNLNGAGNHDWTFAAFDPFSGVLTTGALAKTGPTIKAAVLDDAFWVQGTPGTGGTTQTQKLCSDNACAATTFATCTPTCTSAAGTQVTCTVNTSAVPSGTTLFWVITATTCTTDSSGNLTAHFQE